MGIQCYKTEYDCGTVQKKENRRTVEMAVVNFYMFDVDDGVTIQDLYDAEFNGKRFEDYDRSVGGHTSRRTTFKFIT